MKRKVEIKKLRKLARFIRKVPKNRFKMVYFASGMHLSLDPECTTAACALGWATVVWPTDLVLQLLEDRIGPTVVHTASGVDGYGAATKFFGISHYEARLIFDPYRYRRQPIARTTVARRIEEFCDAQPSTQPKRNSK